MKESVWCTQDSLDKDSYSRLVAMLDGVHPKDAAVMLAKVGQPTHVTMIPGFRYLAFKHDLKQFFGV
jgi:hypothetical protein